MVTSLESAANLCGNAARRLGCHPDQHKRQCFSKNLIFLPRDRCSEFLVLEGVPIGPVTHEAHGGHAGFEIVEGLVSHVDPFNVLVYNPGAFVFMKRLQSGFNVIRRVSDNKSR
jgi:hypothetical protein